MNIRIPCPNPECGAVASIEEESLGRRGRCKKCGQVFTLARPDGKAASPSSGDASAWKGAETARPASNPTDLPETFGRYRILKPLGRGGMGTVYLAFDNKLNRQVAMKVPYFHPADGPEAIRRFEREARAAANLDHVNLCPIFDIGEVDGIHYLTMPYIEGKPLSHALEQDRTFPEAQAAAVVRKLAVALQEAHAQGIIHRDLKPANIMIKRGRDLVIMDFGLARMAGGDEALTRTGSILGTALYMAPEQADGEHATGPASDVYSLGVILYELLAGCRPFEGPWAAVIGLKSVKDPDPPSKHRPDLRPDLDAICLKAIARKPGDRYASMADFAAALDGFLAGKAGPVTESIATLAATPPPSTSPESLAFHAFSGLITQDVTSLRDESQAYRPRPDQSEEAPPERSIPVPMIVAGVSAMVLGLVAFMAIRPARVELVAPVKDEAKPQKRPDARPVAATPDATPRPDAPVDAPTPSMPPSDFEAAITPPPDAPIEAQAPAVPPMEPKAAITPRPDAPVVARTPAKSRKNSKATLTPRPGAPIDARTLGYKRYKVYRDVLSWHEAKARCEAMGGHLAIVTSQEENDFLLGLMRGSGVGHAWIGLSDEGQEGRWRWVDGSDIGYYDAWDRAASQPNNLSPAGETEQFAMLIAWTGGRWWDVPPKGESHTPFPGFLCQWDP